MNRSVLIMGNSVQVYIDGRIKDLLEEDKILTSKVAAFEVAYSGLKDIDSLLELASLKMKIATELLSLRESNKQIREEYSDTVRKKAHEAMFIVEDLLKLTIDDNEKANILTSDKYKNFQELTSLFLLKGGSVFFETRITSKKKSRLISKVIAHAINRWVFPDDSYRAAVDLKNLPPFIRSFLNFFLPWLWQDSDGASGTGIEEGEEENITSEKLKLPLSQAIFYLENEVLTQLHEDLEESPGDPILQAQINEIKDQVATLNKMKYFPRSVPVFPEKGYYTESMTSYTTEGELIINVKIPVSYKSGNRIDRMQEMVKGEIARSLCGRGISPELDEEYSHLKSLESGIRGSSRTPSLKLDIDKAFSILRLAIPTLRQIENKDEFKKLVGLVLTYGEEESRKRIERLISEEDQNFEKLS
jgi:hypothetical protein